MSNKDCSIDVLTDPLVLFQYCSCKTWDADNASISALSLGVFTQNSNSVADVRIISFISSDFIVVPSNKSGFSFMIANNESEKLMMALFKIERESTAIPL
ncbi:hypothetical protein SDC9_204416 [bioreactor metagenome]|uniref:Uncharacterized protein n=1 Tax=bioreactor metagenome TaxID=1076179 RepID=A0A645J8E1_9ZZZZ